MSVKTCYPSLSHKQQQQQQQQDHDESHPFVSPKIIKTKKKKIIWNKLNVSLFTSYALTSAATTIPITLLPSISSSLLLHTSSSSSSFSSQQDDLISITSRIAFHSLLGNAMGKFINGPVGDIFGARRVSTLYAVLMGGSLFMLSFTRGLGGVTVACMLAEFFQSVQWPCCAIVLASHYGKEEDGEEEEEGGKMAYEGGVYMASLAGRAGALVCMPLASLVLKGGYSWRVLAGIGGLLGWLAGGISFCFVRDSPSAVDHPSNPPVITAFVQNEHWVLGITRMIKAVLCETVFPSMKDVLSSGTFWVVAIAHTGASMVRSSERILATYFEDTGGGVVSNDSQGGLVVFLSIGLLFGLAVCGKVFTNLNDDTHRRTFVMMLYISTVLMCYALSFLAIKSVRNLINSAGVLLMLQVTVTFIMGMGIAVQLYQIPAIVAKSFGTNRGTYIGCTEAVSYGVGAMVWRVVAGMVETGDPRGNGWAYGWAGVALLVVVSAVIMLEFMDHYFCNKHTQPQHNNTLQISQKRDKPANLFKSSFSYEPSVREFLRRRIKVKPQQKRLILQEQEQICGSNASGNQSTLPIRLQNLLSLPQNQICADCPHPLPRWASLIQRTDNNDSSNTAMGCFICHDCAGSHRKLGTHVVYVRSVDHDEWKESELLAMENGGNGTVNAIYEALLIDQTVKPIIDATGWERERFVQDKYGYRKYFCDDLIILDQDRADWTTQSQNYRRHKESVESLQGFHHAISLPVFDDDADDYSQDHHDHDHDNDEDHDSHSDSYTIELVRTSPQPPLFDDDDDDNESTSSPLIYQCSFQDISELSIFSNNSSPTTPRMRLSKPLDHRNVTITHSLDFFESSLPQRSLVEHEHKTSCDLLDNFKR